MNSIELGFRLHESSIPVIGAMKAIILDLHAQNYFPIDKSFASLLLVKPYVSHSAVQRFEKQKKFSGIQTDIEKLCELNLGFKCSEADMVHLPPKKHSISDCITHISNAIIDSDKNSKHNFKSILFQLSMLGCEALQLRFYDTISHQHLLDIINHVSTFKSISVEVLLKNTVAMSNEALIDLMTKNPFITKIIAHSSPNDDIVFFVKTCFQVIYRVKQVIDSSSHCGFVTPDTFHVSYQMFEESLFSNSCLSRKISIDVSGNIRNCPAMPLSFGNIENVPLNLVLRNKEFTKWWRINKDQINVCRDCEFRYTCLDCRAFTHGSKTHLGKPTRCAYDPYIGTCGRRER